MKVFALIREAYCFFKKRKSRLAPYRTYTYTVRLSIPSSFQIFLLEKKTRAILVEKKFIESATLAYSIDQKKNPPDFLLSMEEATENTPYIIKIDIFENSQLLITKQFFLNAGSTINTFTIQSDRYTKKHIKYLTKLIKQII